MQWRHQSVHIALCGINKKGVETGERQNRCHDDIPHDDRLVSDKFWVLHLKSVHNVCELFLMEK